MDQDQTALNPAEERGTALGGSGESAGTALPTGTAAAPIAATDSPRTEAPAQADKGSELSPEMQAVRDVLLRQVGADIARKAEDDRRKVQAEYDRKISTLTKQFERKVEASQKALADVLGTVTDADLRARLSGQVAEQSAALIAEQERQDVALQAQQDDLEKAAAEMAAHFGLKREDFKEGEWGGMGLDEWARKVLLPKGVDHLKKQFASAKKEAEAKEQKEVDDLILTGAIVTEAGGSGSAPNAIEKISDPGVLYDIAWQQMQRGKGK